MSTASKPPAKPVIKLNVGQPVRLADHEPITGPDAKPVPFYDYYRNLSGTVAKVFDDGTVSVTIDRASLPAEIRKRHEECEQKDRDKWLDKLSDEERNRLTARQKQFSYRYTVLVGAADILAAGPEPQGSQSAKPASSAASENQSPPAAKHADAGAAPRASLDDLAAAEERHLQEIAERAKGS